MLSLLALSSGSIIKPLPLPIPYYLYIYLAPILNAEISILEEGVFFSFRGLIDFYLEIIS